MLMLLGVATSESMKPRPCFHHCNTVCAHDYHFLFRFILPCFATPITHILPPLRRTSAPIQLLVVLGVLGTQETSCFLIAGLLERDHLQPLLSLGHPLERNCCCPRNLCAWRPNIVYKNRSVRRNHSSL